MPDVYVKGRPHAPQATLTGHYLGMHAASGAKPTQEWYRADEFLALKALAADLQAQVEALTQRRPPKRAGEKKRG